MERWRACRFPHRAWDCLPFPPTGQHCSFCARLQQTPSNPFSAGVPASWWVRTRLGSLWTQWSVLGGSARRLGEGRAAAWSPDGKMIVYANGQDCVLTEEWRHRTSRACLRSQSYLCSRLVARRHSGSIQRRGLYDYQKLALAGFDQRDGSASPVSRLARSSRRMLPR